MSTSLHFSQSQQIVDLDDEHPRILLPELYILFYNLGWFTGTGGGMSIKYEQHIIDNHCDNFLRFKRSTVRST
jgi:hypothetical protein